MRWTTLTFGDHKGQTLPQALLRDTDWFFHMLPIFYGELAPEAKELAPKATAIAIPKNSPEEWRIQYRWEDGGRFVGFSFVRADSFQDVRWTHRERYLDLSWPHRRKNYDKLGNWKLIRDFRRLYFDGRTLTKKRCEAFFDDDDNFVKLKRRATRVYRDLAF